MASAIGGAISGFGSIKEGKKMIRAGQEGIANFEWQDLTNPYKNLTPSTAGADIQREESARAVATGVSALQAGGNRALVGGIGKLQAASDETNRKIAADVDQRLKEIQFAGAGQDVNIQGMMEKRQGDELAGYGNMINVGMDLKQQGKGALVASAGAVDSAAMMAATGGMGGNGLFGAVTPQ